MILLSFIVFFKVLYGQTNWKLKLVRDVTAVVYLKME